MGESLPRVAPEWANVSKLDVVILSCNSSPSLSPSGGQDSEGSPSSACDLPLLSHHDQEGTEAPASLSTRPHQDRGLNKVCRSRFKGQSAVVLHVLCWLSRYQTVEKLQQSYIFIPSKYKVKL